MPERAYVDALLADIEHDLDFIYGRSIQSIFIGGGTPSLLSADAYQRLLQGLSNKLDFIDDIEITLEANPGSSEYEKFSDFNSLGINRLSIGIQSFNDQHLSKIGRIHDRKAAIRAVEAAHYAGFKNFNIDLMFGLPEQQSRHAMADLADAFALEPAHLSWYQLTLEPNTLFHQQPPILPTDDYIWQIQQQGRTLLQDNGYQQYEISAWSRGQTCRHNLNYWQFGDYLAIGAGAHAKISDPDLEHIVRRQRLRSPKDYMHNAHSSEVISNTRELDQHDLVIEYMMNVLRLNQGVSIQEFNARTGLELQSISPLLQQAIDRKMICDDPERIQATPHGLLYLNDLLGIFMQSPD